MVNKNNLPNDLKVMQVGLTESDPEAVKEFAKRVAKFNQRRMSNVLLDVEPDDKNKTFNLRLTFPSHEVQDAFWLE